MGMTKRERLAAAVAGKEVDRVPVALWRHWPVDDMSVEQLALSAAAFQHQYDWDFIKLTPSSNYSVADLGCDVVYRGHPHGTSDYITRPVASPDDWQHLPALDIESGALGQQLACVRRLRSLVGPDVPIIETIFSPMDQARHLVGNGLEIVHLRTYPQQIRPALEMLAATNAAFVRAVIEAGADGIFYATQYARATHLSQSEYVEICRPLDLQIIEAAQTGSFNMLHLHGTHTFFDLFTEYQVHAINWHDRETSPTLADGLRLFPGLVMGGVSQQDIVELIPEKIKELVRQVIVKTGGRSIGISTGCVMPTVAPWGNIRALRAAVE